MIAKVGQRVEVYRFGQLVGRGELCRYRISGRYWVKGDKAKVSETIVIDPTKDDVILEGSRR